MSPVLFVLFFVVLHVCGSSEGLKNITAEPGQNVTLTCKAEDKDGVIVLEWSRKGLGKKKVFVFKDGRPYLAAQHESFRNRVFLKDSQMKDGDLSVDLKNVTMKDTGTYECRVLQQNDPLGSPLSLISIIRLSVDPPGEKGEQRGGDGEKKDEGEEDEAGMSKGYIAGIVVGVIILLGVAAVVVFWISKKRRNQHRGSPEPNEQQIPLRY